MSYSVAFRVVFFLTSLSGPVSNHDPCNSATQEYIKFHCSQNRIGTIAIERYIPPSRLLDFCDLTVTSNVFSDTLDDRA